MTFIKENYTKMLATAIVVVEYIALHSDQIVGIIETLSKIG